MKGKLKKTLCIVLAAAMLSGLGAAFAAAREKAHYNYSSYVSLGDSIAAGYGPYNTEIMGFERVEGSYAAIVADKLGTTLIPRAYSGFRTSELRYMFDGGYSLDEYAFWTGGITAADIDAMRPSFLEEIKNTGLITLNVGSNDIMTYALLRVKSEMGGKSDVLDSLTDKILEKLGQSGNVGALLGQLYSAAKTLGMLPGIINAFVEGMYDGYEAFTENFDAIVSEIYEQNPDVTLVIVGMYNPFEGVTLTDSSVVPIGDAAGIIVSKANRQMQSCASTYGCLYADVTDTECYDFPALTDSTFSDNFVTNVHPTPAGHQFIAQQILSVLPLRDRANFPFVDVPEDMWCYDGVAYCWEYGLMNGTSATTFSPNDSMTRAQFVTVIYRMAGSPDVSSLTEPFTDINESFWAYDAIVWAYNNGVTTGVTETEFCPQASITRAQLVTMLYRWEGSPEITGKLSFTDSAAVKAPFVNAVIWATQNGVVLGYEDGSFAPDNTASRAHMAVIIARYCQM